MSKAQKYFSKIVQLYEEKNLSKVDKIDVLYQFLNQLFSELTEDEHLHFSTLFSRIAYIGQKYKVPAKIQYEAHFFRKAYRNPEQFELDEIELLGFKVITILISTIFEEHVPLELKELTSFQSKITTAAKEKKSYHPLVKVILLGDQEQRECFSASTENGEEVFVQYNIPERNENFSRTIVAIKNVFKFPCKVNLLDVEIFEDGLFRPKAFVVEPDYLIDVTAIAETFKHYGTEPLMYFLKKFMPLESSAPLMLGNIANYFLDELVNNPETEFSVLFKKVFKLNPIAFALFDDKVVLEIMDRAKLHYNNLKKIVEIELAEVGIEKSELVLEPSFYSQKYGIQGRLDALHLADSSDTNTSIIELKSGKIFKPNRDGININHYIQTLLYDLMINSVFGQRSKSLAYILYSGLTDKNLKYATPSVASQMEAINIRNVLLSIERKLASILPNEEVDNSLIEKIRTQNLSKATGYEKNDILSFQNLMQSCNTFERQYFLIWCGFIAREHELAKIGVDEKNHSNGLASLWMNSIPLKDELFSLLGGLTLEDPEQASSAEALITLKRTNRTNVLANFRKGDLVVLYPSKGKKANVLEEQMFKCTLVNIDQNQVLLRLRSRQSNLDVFIKNKYWNVEHDMLDGGFTNSYKSLFSFLKEPLKKKEVVLGMKAPEKGEAIAVTPNNKLTEEQQAVFGKIISSKDYFLLWGPPGTGKTSVMLRELLSHYYKNSDEKVLLLAYTNRAVDEICASIESIDDLSGQDYIRIGSRYSTGEKYLKNLLSNKTENINSRAGLIEVLNSHRIYVSTVSSIIGKKDLFRLVNFDRCIIDEASQILEPMLIGLLTRFKHFTLIGDHKQLPAVVVQDKRLSKVRNSSLNELGINDLSNSYFERLYLRAQEMNWTWAYGRLSHQGRMHKDLMAFSNKFFYNGFLKILPGKSIYQEEKISLRAPSEFAYPELLESRMVFKNTATDIQGNKKMNIYEAKQIGEYVEAFIDLYAGNDIPLTKNSIGIITPFRAQISALRQELTLRKIDLELVSIDTVERYQGGARDVILISLCTNNTFQMQSMVSMSEEGIDRKLNVALTRARNHLVIVGNENLLKENHLYAELMNHCETMKKAKLQKI